jgi:hypothetical protein
MTFMPLDVLCNRLMFLTFYTVPDKQRSILRFCIGRSNPLGSQTLTVFNIIDDNDVFSRFSSTQFVSSDNFHK